MGPTGRAIRKCDGICEASTISPAAAAALPRAWDGLAALVEEDTETSRAALREWLPPPAEPPAEPPIMLQIRYEDEMETPPRAKRPTQLSPEQARGSDTGSALSAHGHRRARPRGQATAVARGVVDASPLPLSMLRKRLAPDARRAPPGSVLFEPHALSRSSHKVDGQRSLTCVAQTNFAPALLVDYLDKLAKLRSMGAYQQHFAKCGLEAVSYTHLTLPTKA